MNRLSVTRKSTFGFSLIELMIAVAIIGILAAIAYPSYTKYLVRAARAEGVSMLLQVMERQENHYRNKLSYSADLSKLGFAAATVQSETGKYVISAQTCASGTIRRCVLLTATGQGRQSSDGDITLNSRGEKSANWPE